MDFSVQWVKLLMLEEIKKPNRKNVVLSPLSINVLLNMITAGMTGESLKLLLRLLGSRSVEEINKKSQEILLLANIDYTTNNRYGKGGMTVKSINGAWVDKHYPLKDSYAELLKGIYDCEAITSCDFANEGNKILKEINLWAKDASRGLIEKVLENISPETTFVRANALYFKGSWERPFDPERTSTEKFYLLDGTTIQVPFVASLSHYFYGSFDSYKVLSVGYVSEGNKSFSMYFFLPHERTGLPNLLDIVHSDSENLFLKLDLKFTDLKVVRIPKFKFSFGFKAEETMNIMGLEMPYKGNHLDYAEMIQNPEDLEPLRTTFIQKAFIEIDEYGTEATAVTVGLSAGCSRGFKPKTKPEFIADHPFLFVIKDYNTGLVFFTGVVLNPNESE